MKRQSSPFDKKTMDEIAGEILPEEFHELWIEYVQMRNRIAKTRIDTDRSQKRIFRQLLNLTGDNDRRICSLEQSIDFKWRGFFEPKNDYMMQFKKRKASRDKALAKLNPPKQSDTDVTQTEDPAERKSRFRAMIRKQADEGKVYAISLVRKWDNPEIVEQAKKTEDIRRKRDLEIKCQEDARNGNFKPHTGGFASIGSVKR